ncbi:flagellar hook capping protein [Solidesulfovibrio carbinoliphilus subsp. oakridgensis]|uniref:Basal-body rod modification protein FlgD n=1 Tax=Solidesulfovibrio carbinoliphilus subsp. oakridgensis TaxID=694327 RepID=G7QCT2_9BACT|nr:flagellar hook assembly protein FlgD [Solidesulfovibrio carbinoliphilus]EHJ46238.1 flagellar hook capping protein [Solidesulfovibrio carbinoliphilus subsp. oakridgensis]
MSYASSLLGTDSSSSSSSTTTQKASSSLGQDAFLQLLVTQLQYQDPLNPMDDKEFVAELAQFSSLEQLTEINTGIDNLAIQGTQQQLLGAVNFIGKTIEATGNAVSLADGKASAVTFTLPTDAETCLVNVLDTSGQVVRTVDLGATTAGAVEFVWDGKDYNGNTMDDGQYQVAMTATDADSGLIKTSSTMTGTVQGIAQENGTYYLNIGDGRNVAFTDITNVLNASSATDTDAAS